MKLLVQEKNKPQCLLYSFAMCLGVEPSALEDEVGHDGKNGYHWQEFIPSILKRGFTPIRYDLWPILSNNMEETVMPIHTCMDHARALLFNNGYYSVLETLTHAVALDDSGIIHDSVGTTREFDWKEFKVGITLIPNQNQHK